MNYARFHIAGLDVAVRSRPNEPLPICTAMKEFATSDPDFNPHIDIEWGEVNSLPDLSRHTLLYDPGLMWRLFDGNRQDGLIVDLSNWAQESYARMWVQKNWSMAVLRELPVPKGERRVLCLGASELLLRTHIISHSGLFLHASGIDHNGNGILYVGHSGEGKSTQSCLWSACFGSVVINEDRMAVKVNGDGIIVHGLPWGGSAEVTRNVSVPLQAIVLLEKADENSIAAVTAAEAFGKLMARAFLPYWDPELLDMAADVVESVISRIQVLKLRCLPEPSAAKLLRSVLT